MKIFRLSKLLFLSVAAVMISIGSADHAAAAGQNNNVREMMNRRSGRSTLPAQKTRTHIGANTGTIRMRQAGPVAPAQSAYQVSDKDGSLFPGGSCENCNGDPEDKDGSLFPGGSCVSCHDSGPLIDTGPCKTCKPKPLPVAKPQMAMVAIPYTPIVYQSTFRNCCAMAPLTLEHVDFNLDNNNKIFSNKIGNYRFRIFGCRRYDKEAILNRGRLMEKNMNFNKIFEEVTGDCYNLVNIPQDLCLQTTPTPLPEYVLTAEISDFFMNVCDRYDWNATQKDDTRTGSAEITVNWRLSNLSKTAVLWEGTTVGYSEINDASQDGEIKLIESAFADATSNLQMAYGFENQLMVRLSPEELSAQRNALIDEEIALNPAKCHVQKELQCVKKCQVNRPEFDQKQCNCPAVEPAPCPLAEPAPCPLAEPAPCPAIAPAPCPVVTPEPAPCTVEKVIVPQVEATPVAVDIYDVQEVELPIIENSGVKTDYVTFDNSIDEKSGMTSSGKFIVVDDTWVTVAKGNVDFNDLCIVDRPPYDVLNPENLYKVRASVVEIQNSTGKKGAGLIISDSFVLTSADLLDTTTNTYKLKTINGNDLTGKVVRVNPTKNIALIMLDQKTEYTPLSLNLELPKTGQVGYMVLGILDVDHFSQGENYIDNNGKILGYRYSEDKGSEIIADTAVQTVTIGGVLIDNHGTINGIAHTGIKTDSGNDLFLPTETALRSVGLSICEKLYEKPSPWQQTVYKPVTEIILKSAPKAPEVLKKEERK